MTASNHAITGALIAAAISKPVIFLPLAFLSHFVLDMLPHFGYERAGYAEIFKHKKTARLQICLDIIGLLILVWLIRSENWLVFVAAVLAVSPDFVWPYRYFILEKRGLTRPGEGNAINRWHSRIQWCEHPWGFYVEIIWFASMAILIKTYL